MYFNPAFVVAGLVSLAAATPTRRNDPTSSCSTGSIQCCNSVQSADSKDVTTILGLLDIVVSDITALVGLGCSPISVIGVGGNSCSAQTVCCDNDTFNGLIALGCSPINISL